MAKRTLPLVWCDFNAAGWDGNGDDDPCYYVFDKQHLARIQPDTGMRVFIYDDDIDEGQPVIVGCAAMLERFKDGWRACPSDGTWCTRPHEALQAMEVDLGDDAD